MREEPLRGGNPHGNREHNNRENPVKSNENLLLFPFGMDIRKNEPLCLHTTLRVGGPARYFVEAKSVSEITEALEFSRADHVPLFILGGGSNLWVSDRGFDGLIIKIATRGVEKKALSGAEFQLVAEAGEEWDSLVSFAVTHGLSGLENISLIPGTVGGAVAGNIGAYGAEVKDCLLWAEAMDLRTATVKRFNWSDCVFRYRHSFFKTPEGRNFILLRAAFSVTTKGLLKLQYKDVQDYFSARKSVTPTLAQVREAIISIRQRKLPDMNRFGTAGSFFKNPVIPQQNYEMLATQYPGLPGHKEADGLVKVPLGWILDKICGLKGVRQGKVGSHSEQALVLVNDGGTAAEVEAFANYVADQVKAMTGLAVEWEVERI